MTEKKKILWISDHPLIPSGVGTQAKYVIEGLLDTGKYKIICLGGAMKHPDYRPQRITPEKYGEDWTIIPVDGYGDKNLVRSIISAERPDAMVIFTDPRFFVWVWEMEDEIRSICPLIYWHVWDNDPAPTFNKVFYESTDFIIPLSLKTHGLLQELKYERQKYIPHAVPEELFKPIPDEEITKFKRENLGPHADKSFIIFWNNRNARRKMTGDVIAVFAKFMEKVGKKHVALLMHTSPSDPEGQDIVALAKRYDVEHNLIISDQRIPPEHMNMFYNVADVTLNIANNEGFGLGTLESLSSGTPIVVQMTGGLQFQIGDWWNGRTDFSNQDEMTDVAKKLYRSGKGKWWGIPLFPASRSCTGSQQIPYIYDDRIVHEEAVAALVKLYNQGRVSRRKLGLEAREWVIQNFNIKKMVEDWDHTLEEQVDKFKSNRPALIRQVRI